MVFFEKIKKNHEKRFLKEIEPNIPKHWLFGTIFSKNIRNFSIEC